MRMVHLVGGVALVGCGGGGVPATTAPIPPRDATARILAPRRVPSVDVLAIDVARLPRMTERTFEDPALDKGSASRFRVQHDGTYKFLGARGLDLEVDSTRVFLTYGEPPIGGYVPAGTLHGAVWRGPANEVDGKVRVVCFEGNILSEVATGGPDAHLGVATRAYEVLAEPVVPGVVYAFRAGRVEEGSIRAPRALLAPETLAEPCADGPDRIELFGPPPVWTSGSAVDPRDAALTACATRGGCTFSRLSIPIERGDLAVAVLVTASAPLDPNAAIPVSNVSSYTFELDWTDGGAAPAGHVFLGQDQAQRSQLHPPPPPDVSYYDY